MNLKKFILIKKRVELRIKLWYWSLHVMVLDTETELLSLEIYMFKILDMIKNSYQNLKPMKITASHVSSTTACFATQDDHQIQKILFLYLIMIVCDFNVFQVLIIIFDSCPIFWLLSGYILDIEDYHYSISFVLNITSIDRQN